MSVTKHEIEWTLYCISLVKHKVLVLEKQLDSLRRHNYPTRGPSTLADLGTSLLREFDTELNSLIAQSEGERHRIHGKSEIVSVNISIRSLNESINRVFPRLIEAIFHSQVDTPLGGVVEAYSEICRRAQFSTQLAVIPNWRHNASYKDLQALVDDAVVRINHYDDFDGPNDPLSGKPARQSFPHLVVIGYPRLDEVTTLRMAIISHEIGHFFDDINQWSETIADNHISHGPSFSGDIPNDVRDAVIARFNNRLKSWSREIIADTIATCLLGPAYVYAFEEFAFDELVNKGLGMRRVSSLAETDTHYPPPQLRLRIMATVCTTILTDSIALPEYAMMNESQQSALRTIQIGMRALVEASEPSPPRGSPTRDSALESIDDELGKVMKTTIGNASSALTKLIYESRQRYSACDPLDLLHAIALMDNIENTLPPFERFTTTDGKSRLPSFAAIMNSGWLYLRLRPASTIFSTPRQTGPVPEADMVDAHIKYVQVQELVAKSVEMLNFQRSFDRRMKRTQ